MVRQMSGLRISPQESDEMEGVEGEHFTYLDRAAFESDINSVEVDDRFLKIPKSIVRADERQKRRDLAKEWALVPYKPPS